METEKNEMVEYLDPGDDSFVAMMNEMVEVRGYKTSAIFTCQGELLYSHTTERQGDKNLTTFVSTLNQLFAHTCSLTEKSGFVTCAEMTIHTGEDVVIIRCSGSECLVGIRLLVVLDDQGNAAITRRHLKNLLPRILCHLTWEPDNLVPLYMRETARQLLLTEDTPPAGHA